MKRPTARSSSGVDAETPARNVYPQGATRAALDAHFAAHPETRAELLGPRSIVQAATADNVRSVMATLDRHPALDVLHPGLRARLEAYVTGVVSAFGHDPRVLGWDLYNEPGGNTPFGKPVGTLSLPLLRDAFAWARAAAPEQPLTSGLWWNALAPVEREIHAEVRHGGRVTRDEPRLLTPTPSVVYEHVHRACARAGRGLVRQ